MQGRELLPIRGVLPSTLTSCSPSWLLSRVEQYLFSDISKYSCLQGLLTWWASSGSFSMSSVATGGWPGAGKLVLSMPLAAMGPWWVPLSGDGDRRGELQDAPAGNRGVWPLWLHDLGYSPPGCHKTSSFNIRSEERANEAECVPTSSPLGCFSYTRGELLKLMKLKWRLSWRESRAAQV